MFTNRKHVLLALMAIVLSLALASCSSGSPGETNAEVRVLGSSGSTTQARSVSSRSAQTFSSGEVYLGGERITDRLTASQTTGQSGTNNQEFTANVEVPAVERIEYRVEPRAGFVFDEWEFDRRNMLRRDHPSDWRSIMMEILAAIKGDNETISINPEYIKYIRPTFDRGAYLDTSYDRNDSDGSSTKPFKTMDALVEFITDERWRGYDDDELTIKIRSGNIGELDLSALTNASSTNRYWDDDELEIELTIAGGYNENWNVSNTKSTIKKIVMPKFKRGTETEMEIEFRNIEFTELDYSMSEIEAGDNEFEMDFRNCEAGTLTNARGVINGLIVKEVESSSNLTFVNSVAPYNAGYKYYHCVITDWSSGKIDGKNNIVVYGQNNPYEKDSNNHYVATFDGYKTNDSTLIKDLMQATPLGEDQIQFGDDDILEEDIEGRDRFLFDDDYLEGDDDDDRDDRRAYSRDDDLDDRFDDDDWDDDAFKDDGYWGTDYKNIKVSYGPYEYRWD